MTRTPPSADTSPASDNMLRGHQQGAGSAAFTENAGNAGELHQDIAADGDHSDGPVGSGSGQADVCRAANARKIGWSNSP